MRRFLYVLLAALLAVATPAGAQQQVGTEGARFLNAHIDSLIPATGNYLTDLTGTVKNPEAVTRRLAEIREKDTLSLVAVVMKTTGDRDEADVAREIGRLWAVATKAELGSATRNTGGVILIVQDRRKCRVEVAIGSEGYMTDSHAGDACRDAAPLFAAGRFGDGIIQIANTFDEYHRGSLAAAAVAAKTIGADSVELPFPWGTYLTFMLVVIAGIVGLGIYYAREREKEEAAQRLRERVERAEYERQEVERRRQEAEYQRAAEAARLERERLEKIWWDALTPEQQAAEIEMQRVRAEQERIRAATAAKAESARRKKQDEEDTARRQRESSYSYSSSSYSSSDSSSSWSSGGSSSFDGGGGGSSY
jgi:uncharacterized membrane protein YgcG